MEKLKLQLPSRRVWYAGVAIAFVLTLLAAWLWQPRVGNVLLRRMHLPVSRTMHAFAIARTEDQTCSKAHRGDLQAIVECGEMLSDDYRNRNRDDRWARKAEGLALLRRAAERGHAGAQYEIGRNAEEQKDYSDAFRWYLESATQEYPEAKSSLAFAYWLGQGTEEDVDSARHWFYESAYDGDPMAAESLGDLFRESRMSSVSYRWYRIAECYGNRPGYTDQIRRMLTPQQVKDADQAAIRFVKEHHRQDSGDGTCHW